MATGARGAVDTERWQDDLTSDRPEGDRSFTATRWIATEAAGKDTRPTPTLTAGRLGACVCHESVRDAGTQFGRRPEPWLTTQRNSGSHQAQYPAMRAFAAMGAEERLPGSFNAARSSRSKIANDLEIRYGIEP
jgi:hypothetical protein